MPNNKHPRYREYHIRSFCPSSGCPQTGSKFKIILYIKDQELRSHAIKHLADTNQIEVWEKLTTAFNNKIGVIINNIQAIKDIGCPYFATINEDDPPCLTCQLYKKCSPHAQEIEELYISMIDATLSKGVKIPRYACYVTHKQLKYFTTIPDIRVVAHACYEPTRQVYNLMTCYCNCQDRWGDFLRKVENKIRTTTSAPKSVIWCTEDTWQTGHSIPTQRQRYKRGAGKAREFLRKWENK